MKGEIIWKTLDNRQDRTFRKIFDLQKTLVKFLMDIKILERKKQKSTFNFWHFFWFYLFRRIPLSKFLTKCSSELINMVPFLTKCSSELISMVKLLWNRNIEREFTVKWNLCHLRSGSQHYSLFEARIKKLTTSVAL